MYIKDEHYIKRNFGREEHFRVPDGYFDTLTPLILNKAKAQDKVTRDHEGTVVRLLGKQSNTSRTISLWHRYRAAAVSAVASVLIGGFAVGAWVHRGNHVATESQQTTTSVTASSSNLDAMMNYSMMDTEDMYSYIADSE